MTNKKICQLITCDIAFKHYIEIVIYVQQSIMDAFMYGKHNGVKNARC